MSWEDDSLFENFHLKFEDLEAQLEKLVDRGDIEENLRTQLEEYEALASTYCNPGELILNQSTAIVDIRAYLNGGNELPTHLDYTINLQIEGHPVEVSVNLPMDYPHVKPDIYVRSSNLSRTGQQNLNEELRIFSEQQQNGEICVFYAISWLEDNLKNFTTNQKKSPPAKVLPKSSNEFKRLWVYSHHIYCKTKRRELLDFAEELSLTGFCLPGRPGIICVEGIAANCDEWWSRIRAMSWKRIICILKENESVINNEESANRRFNNFEEVAFQGGKIRGRDLHMDFGAFYKYLAAHESDYVFKEIFGVDGKISTQS